MANEDARTKISSKMTYVESEIQRAGKFTGDSYWLWWVLRQPSSPLSPPPLRLRNIPGFSSFVGSESIGSKRQYCEELRGARKKLS
jgi:hypothetical protein